MSKFVMTNITKKNATELQMVPFENISFPINISKSEYKGQSYEKTKKNQETRFFFI